MAPNPKKLIQNLKKEESNMPQSQQHIHCLISNCHYWASGNKCDANEILVTSDQFGAQNPDRIDAPQASNLQPEMADDCMSTCCKTFVPSGDNKTNADGVKKM